MKRIYLEAAPLTTLSLLPVAAHAQSNDELKEIDEATRKNQETLKNIPKLDQNKAKTEGTVAVDAGSNVSVVISTPVAIAAILLVGGLALLPLIHIFWKSQAKENDSRTYALTKRSLCELMQEPC